MVEIKQNLGPKSFGLMGLEAKQALEVCLYGQTVSINNLFQLVYSLVFQEQAFPGVSI